MEPAKAALITTIQREAFESGFMTACALLDAANMRDPVKDKYNFQMFRVIKALKETCGTIMDSHYPEVINAKTFRPSIK